MGNQQCFKNGTRPDQESNKLSTELHGEQSTPQNCNETDRHEYKQVRFYQTPNTQEKLKSIGSRKTQIYRLQVRILWEDNRFALLTVFNSRCSSGSSLGLRIVSL